MHSYFTRNIPLNVPHPLKEKRHTVQHTKTQLKKKSRKTEMALKLCIIDLNEKAKKVKMISHSRCILDVTPPLHERVGHAG